VAWIDAKWITALMQDYLAIWDFSLVQPIRKSVGFLITLATPSTAYYAIAMLVCRPRPYPTRHERNTLNFRLESGCYLSHLTYPQFKHLLFTRNALHIGQFTGL